MICIDKEYSYKGASVRVVIEASDKSICKEIVEIVERGDASRVLSIVRMHGGCRILSENPIKVVSGDGRIRVTVEPANFIAKMFWRTVVEKIREICSY
jgi:hypothetical protein